MGEAKGFLSVGFAVVADDIPDAVAVEQNVGFEGVVFACVLSDFAVVKFNQAALVN